jgi:DNA-binding transcriptional MerR regulator
MGANKVAIREIKKCIEEHKQMEAQLKEAREQMEKDLKQMEAQLKEGVRLGLH